MLRIFLVAVAAAFCVFLSNPARALTTNLTLTSNGQELKIKRIILTVHHNRTGKTTEVTGTTDQNGTLRKKISNDDEVDITFDLTYNGQTYYNVPPNGTIDVGGGMIPVGNIPGLVQVQLYLTKLYGCMRYTETTAAGGVTTSQNSACHDPVGGGFSIGYPIRPWKNSFQLMPFAALEFPNTTVNYVFPNGFYLGTRSNWQATLGVKAGPWINPTTWLYGVGGISFLNEKMTLNFAAGQSSSTTTVPGGTVGLGILIRPQWLQQTTHMPIDLFAEVDWTFWEDGKYGTPAVSPAFNYAFRRTDTMFKAGVSLALGGK